MKRISTVTAAAAVAIGLVLTASGCSGGGGSDPVPESSAPAPTMDDEADTDMSDSDMSDGDEAVPVPFMDEKTGKTYMLMVKESQVECILEQSMQGVDDIEAVLATCKIDRTAITN